MFKRIADSIAWYLRRLRDERRGRGSQGGASSRVSSAGGLGRRSQ